MTMQRISKLPIYRSGDGSRRDEKVEDTYGSSIGTYSFLAR
jgi:hypothetical protein